MTEVTQLCMQGGAAVAQEHININHGVGKQSKEKIIKNPAIR